MALGALYLEISRSSFVDSDGANNSLQAWDLLHGHLLLHGWLIGDANFYFLELPVNALTEAVFGLGNFAAHAGSALTYLIVTVLAAVVAVTGSRGSARAVRCAVVVMVLAAPVLTLQSMRYGLEEPDHMGTSAFILGSFLLIDRVAERRFTAPLLCLLLCAGEFSDSTVTYVAVPSIAPSAAPARWRRAGSARLTPRSSPPRSPRCRSRCWVARWSRPSAGSGWCRRRRGSLPSAGGRIKP